jgi:hypothetical protein
MTTAATGTTFLFSNFCTLLSAFKRNVRKGLEITEGGIDIIGSIASSYENIQLWA